MSFHKIYLLDGNDYAQLDVEGLDFSTTFSVADIADISIRKDSISKNIKLKGTKNNNRVFGNLYNINRNVDSSITQNLFFNYQPNKQIDCLVYENDTLILKGQLQVREVNIDPYNEVSYDAIITGSIVNFFSLLGEKKLEHLDFSLYRHTYDYTSISNSLSTSITYSGATQAFELGSGYVYPFINYKNVDTASDKVYFDNFRPAIYVREYFNQIFQQDQLTNFSYEVKGSSDFIEEFNSLIIPDNGEQLYSKFTGSDMVLISKGTVEVIEADLFISSELKMNIQYTSMYELVNLLSADTFNTVFTWEKDVTTSGKVNMVIEVENGNNGFGVDCYVRFAERDYKAPSDPDFYDMNTFSMTSEVFVGRVESNSILPSSPHSFNLPVKNYVKNKQFVVYFYAKYTGTMNNPFTVTINLANINFPADESEVKYTAEFGSDIIPAIPIEVKQTDFIKSIIKMFNLYVYSTLDNPKHLIFQKYDDFYADATTLTNSVDWSEKIDYSGSLKLQMNLENNKKYSFNYKDDADYFNDVLYKKRYNLTYGSYDNTSIDGIANQEKIDLIFSPSPIAQFADIDRVYPVIYKLENDNSTSKLKSNIRILYYNGVKTTTSPYDIVDGADIVLEDGVTNYGNCSHIKYTSGATSYTYEKDLNFGLAKEYFASVSSDIYNVPNLYSNYRNLVTELNDPNFITLECDVLLNESDISNLDFRKPVYLQTTAGDSYFKLLEVTYHNSMELSQVRLQKIVF